MMKFKNINASITADTFLSTSMGYFVDTSSGNVTISLQAASKQHGQEYYIRHITAGNTLTVDPNGSETIGGSATWTSTTAGDYIRIISDGSNWISVDSTSPSASNVTDPTYGSTLTLSSDGTDQSLTYSDDSLVFADGSNGNVAVLDYGDTFEGPAGEPSLTLYHDSSGGLPAVQLTGDGQLLVKVGGGSLPQQSKIWHSSTFGVSEDHCKVVLRYAGADSEIPGTSPAIFLQAKDQASTVSRLAEITLFGLATVGGQEIKLRAYTSDTGTPEALFRLNNDPFVALASKNAMAHIDIKKADGTTIDMFLSEDGELVVAKDGDQFNLKSITFDGASAIGFYLDTHYTLSNAGAKLLSLANNTTEKFYINKDGIANAVQLTASGDIAGIASTNSITNVSSSDVTSTTATLGGIGASGPSDAGQDGWIKVYIGTTAAYVPYWT